MTCYPDLDQARVGGQTPLESWPPQFRDTVAFCRKLAAGSLQEQEAAGTIAAYMLRLMWAEPRADALVKVAEICQQADRDARHNLGTVMHSRREADRRSAAYCDGILRVTEAVAINAARYVQLPPDPRPNPEGTRAPSDPQKEDQP